MGLSAEADPELGENGISKVRYRALSTTSERG